LTGDLPKGNYDFSWCCWVLSFVSDQALLIKKLGDVMAKGGISIFTNTLTWNLAFSFHPSRVRTKISRARDRKTWRESGGRTGWRCRSPALPLAKWVYYSVGHTAYLLCASTNYMWQWPVTFIEVYLPRLIEMGRIDQSFADKVVPIWQVQERTRMD